MRKYDPKSRFAIWFGIFTLIFLLEFFYRYLDDLARGESGAFTAVLIEELTGTYAWGLIFLLVLRFCRRYRISAHNWPRRLPGYLSSGIIFSLVHTTMMAFSRKAIYYLAGLGTYNYGIMPLRYLMEMANYLLFYAVGVALIHLYDHYQESRDHQLRTAQLEAQLAQTELQSLQAQIQPHFLFNALNTISSVVYEDPRRADEMIARLSDFLRHSARAPRRQEVTLQEELDYLNLYLDIMRPRFEDRLQVEIDLEPGVNDALAPKMILQPLVENSIKYSADPDTGRINIAVKAKRENASLRIQVSDSGPGIAATVSESITNGSNGSGVGLSNTARRLEKLYGQNQEFSMRSMENGGAIVSVRLPYHTEKRELV